MSLETTDILIIGSGIGGATMALALADSGKNITILERGKHIVAQSKCRDEESIFIKQHFRSDEQWLDGDGESFNPGNYYYVGGNSKFYGAVMMRYRLEDFSPLTHFGGVSPAWPISYEDLEPWYQQAETHYQVRGSVDEDPTEPYHSGQYYAKAIADEPVIQQLRKRLSAIGLHPSSLPLSVDLDAWLADGRTGWDAFPGTGEGKKDAENIGINKALTYDNVTLLTDAEVKRLHTDKQGHISIIDYQHNKESKQIKAKQVILSAGAVNSAALLLGSANDDYPNGLANSSDCVGRFFMNHNCSGVLAIDPQINNDAIYQKTLQINDFYLHDDIYDMPLGNIQMLGKITDTILKAQVDWWPKWLINWVSRHAIGMYAMSEDLPSPNSRVSVKGGHIVLDWQRSNWQAHKLLIKRLKIALKKAGYPFVISRVFDRSTPSHQCGTTRFGNDPNKTVLDSYCRSHDHYNLFVVDAGFLPTSAAVNPALTIAAQALRVADYIKKS